MTNIVENKKIWLLPTRLFINYKNNDVLNTKSYNGLFGRLKYSLGTKIKYK